MLTSLVQTSESFGGALMNTLGNCILYFSVYSFEGWILECLFATVLEKRPVNRGFLHGPFCPIYGFGALVAIFSFRMAGMITSQKIAYGIIGILLSMILATLLEYVSGFLLFRLFGRKYWDYTDSFLNIGGYVCLKYSLLWGGLSFFMANVFQPQTVRLLSFLPPALRATGAALLLLYFLMDLYITSHSILKAIARREHESYQKEYENCVGDLLENERVQSMAGFVQHGNLSCLDHCKHVSYKSYLVCKALHLDYRSVARAGLLHDYFLYDWHQPHLRWHGFHHSSAALANADRDFSLNRMEKDIIGKHMWPLTPAPPRYRESLIVSMVDKYCTVVEVVEPKTQKVVPDRLRKVLKISWER